VLQGVLRGGTVCVLMVLQGVLQFVLQCLLQCVLRVCCSVRYEVCGGVVPCAAMQVLQFLLEGILQGVL